MRLQRRWEDVKSKSKGANATYLEISIFKYFYFEMTRGVNKEKTPKQLL